MFESLNYPTFSCFHRNVNCITPLYHKKTTRTATDTTLEHRHDSKFGRSNLSYVLRRCSSRHEATQHIHCCEGIELSYDKVSVCHFEHAIRWFTDSCGLARDVTRFEDESHENKDYGEHETFQTSQRILCSNEIVRVREREDQYTKNTTVRGPQIESRCTHCCCVSGSLRRAANGWSIHSCVCHDVETQLETCEYCTQTSSNSQEYQTWCYRVLRLGRCVSCEVEESFIS